MRGPLRYQVDCVFELVDDRGVSKHEAKERIRARGVRGLHNVGMELNIHSHRTMDLYRDNMQRFARFVRERFGIRDLEQVSADHVRAFLLDKLEWKERRFAGGEIRRVRGGVAWSTYQQIIAALYKLSKALGQWAEHQGTGRTYNWEDVLEEMREEGRARLQEAKGPKRTRAYKHPDELVERIERMAMGERFPEEIKLGARLQLEAGIRVKELLLIRAHQLRGLRMDPYTKTMRGWIEVKGKGGKTYETCMSRETYLRLESYLRANDGVYRLSYRNYIEALRIAAMVTGDSARGKGTHGLRWNRAQRRFEEVAPVVGALQAQYIVSQEMGHERPDITLHYLERTRGGKKRGKKNGKAKKPTRKGRAKASEAESGEGEPVEAEARKLVPEGEWWEVV